MSDSLERPPIDYRWTSRTPTFGKFHWSIILFFPSFFITMWIQRWIPSFPAFYLDLVVTFLYLVYLFFCSRRKFGPIEMAQYLWVRFVYGLTWIIRP